MNNTIRSHQNVNFKAKFDLSKVKGDKERLQNIAELFENSTKKYPKDTVELRGNFNKVLGFRVIENGKSFDFCEASIYENATNKFKNMKDIDVANNLVDLYKHLKNGEACIKKGYKFINDINIKYLYDENGVFVSDYFHDLMAKIMSIRNENFIKNHSIFHDGGIIL